MTQLLSVACLSLAAKMEETSVPQSLDLQVRNYHGSIAHRRPALITLRSLHVVQHLV
jgi:hypothetical protein